MSWQVRPGEDRLLHTYWNQIGGRLWREVPIGGKGSKVRRIDGVIAPDEPTGLGDGEVPWALLGRVLIVEVKQTLDETAIGQAAAGAEAARELGAQAVEAVVVVRRIQDAALADVCTELGIQLIRDVKPAVVISAVLGADDPLLGKLDALAAELGLSNRAAALLEATKRGLGLSAL